MAEIADRVFISYSRRDYYPAESLSLQLAQRGVPAWMDVLELQPGSDWESSLFEAIDGCAGFVLIASPAALDSPHVRAQWQRALAQRRRVLLLGWHQRVRLPPELQGCEWLDFRGRFAPALDRLVTLLGATDKRAPRAGARPGRGPWAPPAVVAVLVALLLPIAGYAFGVAPDVAQQGFADLVDGLGVTGGALLFALFSAALVWALSFSLLQRRMGMTRLMLCLGFVAAPFVLSAWKIARHGAGGLQGTPLLVAQRVLEYLPWVLGAGCVAVVGDGLGRVGAAAGPAALDAHRQGLGSRPAARGGGFEGAGVQRRRRRCRRCAASACCTMRPTGRWPTGCAMRCAGRARSKTPGRARPPCCCSATAAARRG